MKQVPHLIDGRPQESLDGAVFDSIDPFSRQPWARVARGGPAEVAAATAAARGAFDRGPWPRMSPADRADRLMSFAAALDLLAPQLSLADTRDMGKPLGDGSGADVRGAIGQLREHAQYAAHSTAQVYPGLPGHHVYGRHEPAGVVAAITPWNFPVLMALSKIAPALAWGNTVVLKPAEQSPVSAMLIGQAAVDAGLPPGVLNVVHGVGPGGAGEQLVASPGVDRITFTGSTAGGAAIAASAARRLVPCTLECGGKAANLIFADADLESATRTAAAAAFANSGQICVAGSRLYVQRPVFDQVVDRLIELAEAMTIGDPREPGTTLGPLSSAEQYERVRGFLAGIPADGGRLRCGGDAGEGWFIRPTVVTGLPPQARACREEIFGPVVVAAPFDTEQEAVELANDSEYGLSASFFTADSGRVQRVSQRLRAGIVWANTFGVRDHRAPFGGVGQSGLGREGGAFSRDFYTEAKAVVVGY